MHPRKRIHYPTNLGDRFADVVVGFLGSGRFILYQTIVVAGWIIGNVLLIGRHPFDPYPFILLNLAFSTQAAYAAPLILMSQNRSADIDRKRDDLEAEEVDMLTHINQAQLEILQELRQKGA